MQCPTLHKNRCHGTTAAIELGFNHSPFRHTIGIGFQIENFSLQGNHLKQFIEIAAFFCRDLDFKRIAAHRLDLHFILQQFRTHAFGIGAWLVDFVDGHNHRHFRSLGMIDGFNGLRHHTVISRHHQNHNIRDLRTTRTHRRKGGMAGRINEGDLAAQRRHDLISTDMLGNATGFTAHHIGFAQGIEQGGFAVIDMAHDGDNRRTADEIVILINGVEQAFFNIRFRHTLHGMTKLFRHKLCGIGIDHIGDLDHLALLHQEADHVDGPFSHTISQFLNGDCFGNNDFA